MEGLQARAIGKLEFEHFHTLPYKVLSYKPRSSAFTHHMRTDFPWCSKPATGVYTMHRFFRKHTSSRAFTVPVSLDEEPLVSQAVHLDDAAGLVSIDESGVLLPLKPELNELKSLLVDSERAKLLRKLSEANQYNRFLKRQLQIRDNTLVNFKKELAVLEYELQALVGLAKEVANSGLQLGSRKINGKYILNHLLSRLEAVREKVKEHLDNDSAEVKEITLFWIGMAESVQVMGSFDGWSQGEHLSSEYTGSYTRFATTIKLLPGRYEIKFLVDGEWQLSPEFPTVGEGQLRNNLLVVE